MTHDPWLAELVRRAPDAGEDDSIRRKVEALAEIICWRSIRGRVIRAHGNDAKLYRA